jgi:hypothetical protein
VREEYMASRCPRCTHWIPRDESPGEYPGAKSRVLVDGERVIEICAICGEDEGYEMVTFGKYTPVSEWPIEDWMEVTKDMERAIKDMKKEFYG